MSRFNLAWLIAVPMCLLAAVSLSFTAPARDREKEYKLVRMVVDVLAEVDQHYVRPLDDKAREKLVEDMINGGLERLDPYSQYMNSDELRRFESETEGNFGGVGIQLGVDPRTGMPMVLSPIAGTPAYEAGVLAGDIILKINDKSTEQMRTMEVIRNVQGEPGSKVSLTVLHDGAKEPETFTLTRAKIEVSSVLGFNRRTDDPKEWDWFADASAKVGYIRIVQFTEKTTPELKAAIERLQKEGAKSLILDLRDNPGGLLTSAIEVSDLFLSGGRIVSTRDRNERGREWDAKADGIPSESVNDYPLTLLINKNSASASEIVAAALQDNKRARIVGERSYGKGSVQKVIRLGGDPPTALKLTTDTYWRPSNANIHRHPDSKESDEWGVKPDAGFEIVMKDDERLDYLRYKRNKDIIGKVKPKEGDKPFVDRAVEKAIEAFKK
jgi:carboxyl-terminal processing protease